MSMKENEGKQMNQNKKWWHNRPWRLIQTNLREIDMSDIRADRYVEELLTFKANVVMINTAGIIASYPTKLPYHFQSPYLLGDSLEQIIEDCHRADIKVIARTDFSKVRREIYEQHPEWAYVSSEGRIVDYNGDVHVCLNGEYQQHYALKIIEEALTTLDVDGIYFNMSGYQVRDYSGHYYGICHCDSCRARFRERFGTELPKKEDIADPIYQNYQLFQRETLKEYAKKVHRFILGVRPNLCISNNLELKQGFYRNESNTAIDRPLPHWQYSASDNTKWVVGSYPDMVPSNTTVDFIDFPYRYVAVSPAQQKLRLAQNLANGGCLDYYLIGRLDNHEDRSGYEGIRELFHYHAKNGEEYLNLKSEAKIALIHGPDGNTSEFRGWFRFLTENHFLFDTLMTATACELPWERYEAVIVPDYQPLDDELAAKLDRFAEEGGAVVSVGQSGFKDAHLRPREVPALKSTGMSDVKKVRSDMISSCFKIDGPAVFKRLPNTELIYMYGPYVYAEYEEGCESYLHLIPPHPFGPPERCYYTTETDHPAVVVHPYGKGKGVVIPWNPGSVFYRQGYVNTTDFIADVLESIVGLEPVRGNLSPMAEVSLFRQEGGSAKLLHLVNASGHFGVSFFEPVTMNGVEIAIPLEEEPRSATRLVEEGPVEHHWDSTDRRLTIKVGRLALFEAIKIQFES